MPCSLSLRKTPNYGEWGRWSRAFLSTAKNVLIDDKPEGLLPEWLRFIRGVIDSADIPLNISRESMQDSSLVRKLNRVVTKRFLKFLDGEAKDDTEKYAEFYSKFGRFLKEGIVVDFDHRESLSRLLRFESSMMEKGEETSFTDYLTRAKDGQEKIYYLTGADRATIEAGPYLEALKSRGFEVIYFFDNIDEVLLQHLREFDGKELVSAASANLELDDDVEVEGVALNEEKTEALCAFLKEEFGDKGRQGGGWKTSRQFSCRSTRPGRRNERPDASDDGCDESK